MSTLHQRRFQSIFLLEEALDKGMPDEARRLVLAAVRVLRSAEEENEKRNQ